MANWVKSTAVAAFSLIELSLALVVIAVISVLVYGGVSISENTKLVSVYNQIDDFSEAIDEFERTYGGLPGDISDVSSFGEDAVAGNGNGKIDSQAEALQFWKHLSNTGMIEGDYSGTLEQGAAMKSGVHVPKASLKGAAYSLYYPGGSHYGDDEVGADIAIDISALGSGVQSDGLFTSVNAADIDAKFDDGKPGTGKIRAYGENCATTGDEPAYKKDKDNKACSLRFIVREAPEEEQVALALDCQRPGAEREVTDETCPDGYKGVARERCGLHPDQEEYPNKYIWIEVSSGCEKQRCEHRSQLYELGEKRRLPCTAGLEGEGVLQECSRGGVWKDVVEDGLSDTAARDASCKPIVGENCTVQGEHARKLVACHYGYTGDIVLECESGFWKEASNSCEAITCEGGAKPGTVVEGMSGVSCGAGAPEGKVTRVCGLDGQWSFQGDSCAAALLGTCTEGQAPKTTACPDFKKEGEITYICAGGKWELDQNTCAVQNECGDEVEIGSCQLSDELSCSVGQVGSPRRCCVMDSETHIARLVEDYSNCTAKCVGNYGEGNAQWEDALPGDEVTGECIAPEYTEDGVAPTRRCEEIERDGETIIRWSEIENPCIRATRNAPRLDIHHTNPDPGVQDDSYGNNLSMFRIGYCAGVFCPWNVMPNAVESGTQLKNNYLDKDEKNISNLSKSDYVTSSRKLNVENVGGGAVDLSITAYDAAQNNLLGWYKASDSREIESRSLNMRSEILNPSQANFTDYNNNPGVDRTINAGGKNFGFFWSRDGLSSRNDYVKKAFGNHGLYRIEAFLTNQKEIDDCKAGKNSAIKNQVENLKQARYNSCINSCKPSGSCNADECNKNKFQEKCADKELKKCPKECDPEWLDDEKDDCKKKNSGRNQCKKDAEKEHDQCVEDNDCDYDDLKKECRNECRAEAQQCEADKAAKKKQCEDNCAKARDKFDFQGELNKACDNGITKKYHPGTESKVTRENDRASQIGLFMKITEKSKQTDGEKELNTFAKNDLFLFGWDYSKTFPSKDFSSLRYSSKYKHPVWYSSANSINDKSRCNSDAMALAGMPSTGDNMHYSTNHHQLMMLFEDDSGSCGYDDFKILLTTNEYDDPEDVIYVAGSAILTDNHTDSQGNEENDNIAKMEVHWRNGLSTDRLDMAGDFSIGSSSSADGYKELKKKIDGKGSYRDTDIHVKVDNHRLTFEGPGSPAMYQEILRSVIVHHRDSSKLLDVGERQLLVTVWDEYADDLNRFDPNTGAQASIITFKVDKDARCHGNKPGRMCYEYNRQYPPGTPTNQRKLEGCATENARTLREGGKLIEKCHKPIPPK